MTGFRLNLDRMAELAKCLEGEHDFTVFAGEKRRRSRLFAEGRSESANRIFRPVLDASAGRLSYRIRGSGFLKHMVRNVVGTLLWAGRGTIEDLDVLPSKSGPTAPAKGLFLMSVEY